jgi:TDG/mug DNA glycosylase family protein
MTDKSNILEGFGPVGASGLSDNPIGMVLGSFPSRASLEAGEYYGNPRNHFWSILGLYFGINLMVADYREKTRLLTISGLALWDVFATCERAGSLDSSIRSEKANPIPDFLVRHPRIIKIALNGEAATSGFGEFFMTTRGTFLRVGETIEWKPDFDPTRSIRLFRLPSTSPVPSREFRRMEDKIPSWFSFFEYFYTNSV